MASCCELQIQMTVWRFSSMTVLSCPLVSAPSSFEKKKPKKPLARFASIMSSHSSTTRMHLSGSSWRCAAASAA